MPGATCHLFEQAMREPSPSSACIRVTLARSVRSSSGIPTGAAKALTFEFDGSGSKGPVRCQWKCLALAEASNAELIDAPWCSGEKHGRSQCCAKDVDLDVNPHSPYNPQRRL